jgi:hypothetical protein
VLQREREQAGTRGWGFGVAVVVQSSPRRLLGRAKADRPRLRREALAGLVVVVVVVALVGSGLVVVLVVLLLLLLLLFSGPVVRLFVDGLQREAAEAVAPAAQLKGRLGRERDGGRARRGGGRCCGCCLLAEQQRPRLDKAVAPLAVWLFFCVCLGCEAMGVTRLPP